MIRCTAIKVKSLAAFLKIKIESSNKNLKERGNYILILSTMISENFSIKEG